MHIYQAQITLYCNKTSDWSRLVSEQTDDPSDMSQDDSLHIRVVGNDRVVQSNDLDIYNVISRADDWRLGRDLIFRLLTNEDESELEQHVLGILAAPGTTIRPSLVEQAYDSCLSQRTLDSFARIQNHEFTDNRARRTQLHFLIFVTMAIEQEFCQYVAKHCQAQARLRHFVNECVKPAFARLLSGEMLTTCPATAAKTAFGIEEFVMQCRLAYMTTCRMLPAACH